MTLPARWPEPGRSETGSVAEPRALARLRREWALLLASSVLLLVLAWSLLEERWPFADRWLGVAASLLGVAAAGLWLVLGENRRSGESGLLPGFGLATLVTVGRGVALLFLAGFLVAPRPDGALAWLPALLYTAAAVGDLLDGRLARRGGRTTILGARLDLELDAWGILVATLLGILWGQLPVWYLLVGLSRYAFVLAVRWRRWRRGPTIPPLPASPRRRLFAGFQMGFLSAVLWPIVPAEGARLAAWVFALPLLAGFVRDWLVVSGRLDPRGASYRRWQELLERFFFARLPVVLRLAFAATAPAVVLSHGGPGVDVALAGWTEVLRGWGCPFPGPAAACLAGAALVASLLLLAGLLARVQAVVLVAALCVHLQAHGSDPPTALLLVSILGVLLLGAGGETLPKKSS